jgi:hypothetical protein
MRRYCILPFSLKGYYSLLDVEFMLPGIIHREFINDNKMFNELILESQTYFTEDKGDSLVKHSYYENMADVVGKYLRVSGLEEMLGNVLHTHYVHDTQITVNSDLLIELQPRYGHHEKSL